MEHQHNRISNKIYEMIEITYRLFYKKSNTTKYQKVHAIDKTHALRLFWPWVKQSFKSAKRIEIISIS